MERLSQLSQKTFAIPVGASESTRLMQSPTTTERDTEAAPPAPAAKVITEPNYSGTPQPIGPWTERADFPQCALGAYVSIHGFEGVIVEIVNQSIKVLAPDGVMQRFNAYRLKALFAPPDRSQPVAERRPAWDEPEPAPPRVHIANPDFTAPTRVIRAYASQPDFPQCAYGKHVDISGYSGVVVEIVNGSLKVQSAAGAIRSYNAAVLKKLYGKA